MTKKQKIEKTLDGKICGAAQYYVDSKTCFEDCYGSLMDGCYDSIALDLAEKLVRVAYLRNLALNSSSSADIILANLEINELLKDFSLSPHA